MSVRLILALAALGLAAPAFGQNLPPEPLPPTVQSMIDDAFASGTDAEIEAVVKFARRAYPAHAAALDARLFERRELRQTAERERIAAERARLAAASLLDNWTGRLEVGASRATGNVDNFGLYGSMSATREGLNWRHALRANVDLQETDGIRTQERLLAAYEPRFKVNDRFSTYALLQAERDPLAGYDARYSASLGLGYALVKQPRLTVDVQGGPAYRYVQLTDNGNEQSLSGRAALDARYTLRPGVALTQNATAYLDGAGNTFTSATGLEAQLIGSLTARVSYNVQYESEPPAGRVATDTQSRVSLVYGF